MTVRRTVAPLGHRGRQRQGIRLMWSAPGCVVLGRRVVGGTAVVTLAGELDIACAERLEEALAGNSSREAPDLAVDLCRVTFMDCSSLPAFLAAYEESRRMGGCLRVAAPAREPLLLLRATGLTALFCVHPTLRSATHPRCARHTVGSTT